MSKRPPQGKAKIAFWGGVERGKENPQILVYDDGSTNPPHNKPVWRRKMSPADVLAAHEVGAMHPLFAHPKCEKSKAITVDELRQLAGDSAPSNSIRLEAGRGEGKPASAIIVPNSSFPWNDDIDDDLYRVAPKDRETEWNDKGELVNLRATFRSGEVDYLVRADGSGNVWLEKGGEKVSPHMIGLSEDGLAVWAEWWAFRSQRMSHSTYMAQINRLHIHPIIKHETLSAIVDRAVNAAMPGRRSDNEMAVVREMTGGGGRAKVIMYDEDDATITKPADENVDSALSEALREMAEEKSVDGMIVTAGTNNPDDLDPELRERVRRTEIVVDELPEGFGN